MLPLVRISQELYDKVKKISEQTGLSIRVILDIMGKNMEFEFKITIKEKENNGKEC